MRVVRPMLPFLFGLALGACADGGGVPAATALDSAGVRIVENSAGQIEGLPLWRLELDTEIGAGADPAVPLFRVVSISPLDEDRVAIGMTAPPRLVVADEAGTTATEVGRPGDGPGEFQGIRSVIRMGSDSLGVWDAERRRLSVYSPSGTLHREVDLSDIAPVSSIASPNVTAASGRTSLLPAPDGTLFLFNVGIFGPGAAGVRRVALRSSRITAAGDLLNHVGSFPGEATFFGEGVGVAPYPLGPDTHGAVLGDRLIVGTAETEEYRVFSPDGELEQVVRWADSDTLVAGERLASWTAFVEAWLGAMPEAEARSIREMLDAMPTPARFPAYSGLLASGDDEVWVGAYHPGQLELTRAFMGPLRVPVREWLVFGDDGVARARLTTAAGFRPMKVVAGRVWGVATDDLGVESVRAYRVLRDGG